MIDECVMIIERRLKVDNIIRLNVLILILILFLTRLYLRCEIKVSTKQSDEKISLVKPIFYIQLLLYLFRLEKLICSHQMDCFLINYFIDYNLYIYFFVLYLSIDQFHTMNFLCDVNVRSSTL